MAEIVSQLGADRWLMQTICHECFIDVEASSVSDAKWITLNLLSTHNGRYEGRIRTRLRYAWRVLTGQGWPAFELNTLQETDALLWALYEARRRAFDAPVPGAITFSGHGNHNVTLELP